MSFLLQVDQISNYHFEKGTWNKSYFQFLKKESRVNITSKEEVHWGNHRLPNEFVSLLICKFNGSFILLERDRISTNIIFLKTTHTT